MQPLAGHLVVDLTRYLPGVFAARELRRLGARVVRVEAPDGDPLKATAPAWYASLAEGMEVRSCDLHTDPSPAARLIGEADVVLEGFRPGVADAIGVGPALKRDDAVWCSITGFGADGPHAQRAGHDLNYVGWAGLLEDTPASPMAVQVADLASGALGAVTQVLAALLDRERTGRGAVLTVSMTHRSHDFVAHRLDGDPRWRLLTGGAACYRTYETADGRHVTVAALEPRFFARLCDVIERPELAREQYGDQEALAAELTAVFRTRPLDEWLALTATEDVCLGPVWTREEAAAVFGRDE